jgi:hypothetical protein
MAIIEGFRTIETFITEGGYVCIAQDSLEFGQVVEVFIPIRHWKSLVANVKNEILEHEKCLLVIPEL